MRFLHASLLMCLWLAPPQKQRAHIQVPSAPTPTISESIAMQIGEQKGQLIGINEHLASLDGSVKGMQDDIKDMRKEIDKFDFLSNIFTFSVSSFIVALITVLVTLLGKYLFDKYVLKKQDAK